MLASSVSKVPILRPNHMAKKMLTKLISSASSSQMYMFRRLFTAVCDSDASLTNVGGIIGETRIRQAP